MARPFTYGRGPQADTDTRGAAIGGSARTPRVGMTLSDLQAQGEQHGWTVRSLTMTEINQMSSAELRWHEQFNSESLSACFQKKANVEENNKNQAWWDVRKKWTGVTAATDDDKAKMRDVAERFFQLYPQVIRDKANADKIWDYMKQNNLPPTDIASPIQAFEDLAQDPNSGLALNPSAISAGSEQNISGTELTSHRHFHLLLQSHRRPTAEESLSADEWKAKHSELNDETVPFLIRQRQAQKQITEQHFQEAANATSKSNVTSFTDYKNNSNK